jgi:glycosyltransferase involved in cell wall biosynthesis
MTPERISVCTFVASFEVGGSERQFTNLALGLDRTRFDVRFGCLRPHGHFLEPIVEAGLPVTSYPLRHFYTPRSVAQQYRLASNLRRSGAAILHTYNFYANVFALPAAWAARTPVRIASIRDPGVYLNSWQKTVQRLAVRAADCILVNADSIRRWLVADGVDPSRIATIPNGIDLSRFSHTERRPELRGALGIAPDAPLIVVVSRLAPGKGLNHFIKAMGAISAREPRARALIVGEAAPHDAGLVDRLRADARAAGVGERIVFCGFRADVPELLAEASVVVQPSENEGLSNALIESMASGRPVVATRVGGTPEAIDDGATGVLVPPADPAALAPAVSRVLEQPDWAAALGANAQRHACATYSVSRMVRDTERLYVDLLRRSRRPGRTASESPERAA